MFIIHNTITSSFKLYRLRFLLHIYITITKIVNSQNLLFCTVLTIIKFSLPLHYFTYHFILSVNFSVCFKRLSNAILSVCLIILGIGDGSIVYATMHYIPRACECWSKYCFTNLDY